MKIQVLAIGKPKDVFVKKESESYLQRLGMGLSAGVDFLPDFSRGKGAIKAIELESKSLLKAISPRDHVILLDEKGVSLSSESFSHRLFLKLKETPGKIVFVIGGPFGVGEEVHFRSNEKLSLSSMTMTHEMCLLFLCEQIYRAAMIKQNSPYHHK